MMVHSTHGLFLTCTQNLVYIYTTHDQLLPEPLVKRREKKPQLTWKADILLMVANPHPLWSLAWQQLPRPLILTPFTHFPPLQPALHYITTKTSTISVFFVRDTPLVDVVLF
jgi:hypothetical protein